MGKEHSIDAHDGEMLYMACERAGVELPNSCGLGCQCTTCVVEVLEGHQNLTALDEEEVDRAEEEGIHLADPESEESGSDPMQGLKACRLSCACQVIGDVIVQQPDC